MFPVKSIILAGGKGTRLRPITHDIPKALVPVGDRTLTELVLDIIKKAGVNDVVLSVCYMADKIRDHFGDGSKFGFDISYVEEKEPMGTGAPLLLMDRMGDTFIMMNGDNLFNVDLKKMYKFHIQSKAIVTIALTFVPRDNVSAYGVAKLGPDDKILEFVEKPKPKDAPSNWINSGYYIMEPEVFDILCGRNFAMIEKDLFPALAKLGKLFGYKSDGQWFDTGTQESYEKVKREWKGV